MPLSNSTTQIVSGKQKKKKPDFVLITALVLILAIGFVMVYSTSSYKAVEMYGDSFYFLKRQLIFSLVGMTIMFIIAKKDYEMLYEYSRVILIVSMVLLCLVYIIGSASHGSSRWLNIGPFRFQPSEFAKLALIIYTAAVCTAKTKELAKFKSFLKAMILPFAAIVLIAIENLSTAIICLVIVAAVTFVASPKNWYFVVLGLMVVVFCVLFIAFAGYRAQRIKVWLHPEQYDNGYQTLQSLYAIGSGGLFGRGLFKSIQKMGFIPESHNDMIFSVICEELGFIGAVMIIALFVIIIKRCAVVAMNSRDRFGGLLVVGVMAHIAIQVLINICVVTNTIPPTGVPLPFVSYGGSSMVCTLMELGIVFSVASHREQMTPDREDKKNAN